MKLSCFIHGHLNIFVEFEMNFAIHKSRLFEGQLEKAIK